MKEPRATVRPARPADERDLLVLWQALLEEQGRLDPLFRSSDDASERWVNDFREWVGTELRCVVVAERNGETVGFATAEPWYPAPVYAPAREVLVTALYVAEPSRREGIGTALLEEVRQWALDRRAERIRLEVVAGNEAGTAFWLSLSARPVAQTLVLPLRGGEAGDSEE